MATTFERASLDRQLQGGSRPAVVVVGLLSYTYYLDPARSTLNTRPTTSMGMFVPRCRASVPL